MSLASQPIPIAQTALCIVLAGCLIWERRRSAEDRARFSDTLESITDAFVVLDTNARFIYANRQAERLLQKSRAQLLGAKVWEEFPEAVGSQLQQEYERAVATRSTADFEFFYPPFQRWLDVRAYPRHEGLTVYLRDITKRKLAEEERTRLLEAERAARAEAETAQHEAQLAVETRDRLVALASHDLRGLLTAIKGIAQFLSEQIRSKGLANPDRILDGLWRIDKAGTRMSAQIDDLLDVAKMQIGQSLELNRAPVDLVALVKQVIDDLQDSAAEHGIRMQATCETLMGDWDQGRLERMVANLVSNAIKYSPGGGEVLVSVDQQAEDDGVRAVLTVQDQGIGIPQKDLPFIFESFHRGENVIGRIPGSGIGLASARQTVEDHGGTIVATSDEGQGTTFTCRLPTGVKSHRSNAP